MSTNTVMADDEAIQIVQMACLDPDRAEQHVRTRAAATAKTFRRDTGQAIPYDLARSLGQCEVDVLAVVTQIAAGDGQDAQLLAQFAVRQYAEALHALAVALDDAGKART